MTTLMTAALPFPTAVLLHPPTNPAREVPVGPPAELADADVARIAAALDATRAESTRAGYGHAWRGWQRWCDSRADVTRDAGGLAIRATIR